MNYISTLCHPGAKSFRALANGFDSTGSKCPMPRAHEMGAGKRDGGHGGKLGCARPSKLWPWAMQAGVAGILIYSRGWKFVL